MINWNRLTLTKMILMTKIEWNWSKIAGIDQNCFNLTLIDWIWPNLIKIDWNWPKLINFDLSWQKSTKNNQNQQSFEIPKKFTNLLNEYFAAFPNSNWFTSTHLTNKWRSRSLYVQKYLWILPPKIGQVPYWIWIVKNIKNPSKR